MSPSTRITKFPKLRRGVLLIALATFSAVAAHERRQRVPNNGITCSTASEAKYVAWHRQQADRLQVDSISASLRLFTTFAEELAADGLKRGPVTSSECGDHVG